jgi:NodT family efflux transporter outer membrane factor (OMF) lipoprotein
MTRRTAILPFVLLLAGCVPGGIVPQQKEIAGNSVGLGDTPAPAIDETWWTAFADPGLDRLMAEALKGNPDLGQALARLRAAKAGVEAADAVRYPHVDFNAQEQRDRFSDTYIYPPPYAGSFRWIGTVEGDLSWDIDFWGKQAAELAKANALRAAARMDLDAARLAVSGAVFEAYVDLDRACKLADIAAQTERERSDTLALTERRLRDGLDSKVEEQEALALLAQAREARESADSDRDIVVHELAALIGRGADAYPDIMQPSLKLDAALPLPASLPADLLARRPDIAAAEARVNAALEGRKAARAAFYPDVDLLASVGWAAIGLGPMFTARSLQYGGGPAVHLPLFDAGALRAQYAGATAEIDSAVADYNGALVNAVRQTADALTRIRSLEKQIALHRQTLDAAQAGYRLAETRYRTGLTNQLTMLNAQNVLFQARQGDVSLRAEHAIQRLTLLLAVGGGFQPPHANSAETSSR